MTAKRTVKKVSQINEQRNNFLSLDTIEVAHKSKVQTAYIEEMGGSVHYRPVGADVALAFMEEGISRADQIRAMCRFMSETLCDPDGNEFISFDRAMKLPIDTIETVVSGIALARKTSRESKAGNVSRR